MNELTQNIQKMMVPKAAMTDSRSLHGLGRNPILLELPEKGNERGTEFRPDILCQLPETVRNIFSSGITTGGLTAILSNLLIQIKE